MKNEQQKTQMAQLKQNVDDPQNAASKNSSWLWPKGEPVFVGNKKEDKPRQNWLWAEGEPVFVSKNPVRRGRRSKNVAPAHTRARPGSALQSDTVLPEEAQTGVSEPPPVKHEEDAAPRAERPDSQEEKAQSAAPRLAQPVRATREELSAGKISRVWNSRLARPDFAISFLWEGYFALQNGAVSDLEVSTGKVNAQIEYQGKAEVELTFSPVEAARWEALVAKCGYSCESWATLLIGSILFDDIRRFYVDPAGLIPSRKEIAYSCTCPLFAPAGCVHTTTALLALGAWLQTHPLDLLTLRSAKREILFERSALLRGEQQVSLSAPELRALERQFGVST